MPGLATLGRERTVRCGATAKGSRHLGNLVPAPSKTSSDHAVLARGLGIVHR